MSARRVVEAAADHDVGHDGERVVVANAFIYWAHLSIYRFAVPFATGRRVLDAGSGEGYGAAYLAQHGASFVLGLDAAADAVAHARRRYRDPRVRFEVADLNEPLPLSGRSFDLVFSSNVFEHVCRVDVLAAGCARVLTPDGVAVVAVPSIVSPGSLEVDMKNHFHVHHIPPAAWAAKLGRFFGDVRCHRHRGGGAFASAERVEAEAALPPDRVTIRETDFEFPETTVDELHRGARTHTAVFVCRRPRAEPLPETLAERTPAEWCEGEVAARLLAAERATIAELRQELAALPRAQRLAAVGAARIWRASAPLRRVVTAVRTLRR